MSIINRVTKNLSQIAVYWANPTNDGYGTFTYDDPIEIECRWEDKDQMVQDDKGVMITSRSHAYVGQDVEIEGLLYLGRLDDLDSAQEDDPATIPGICIIKRFEKLPRLGSSTEFLRTAFLTTWQT